ncbi:hypothetical protein D3800_00265 [Microcystis aeruginosa NIES-298]|uniref:hypothetical protein n=1 Tax=Microcystis aeruginosa TaxID=1126 RepID=UPI001057392A|nr:hypothetical protein [Microcystis aeruginosa]QHU81915.1 hypothetical protein D3800_00265 [Microcystis aeruginosa NIES-298]WOB66631.1 hypothetical protein PJW00_13395 [Microcystis aeruginosa LE3]
MTRLRWIKNGVIHPNRQLLSTEEVSKSTFPAWNGICMTGMAIFSLIINRHLQKFVSQSQQGRQAD